MSDLTPKAKCAPNIFQLTGLSLEEFKRKARAAHSAKALAEDLGICINSAQKYLHLYGLSKPSFRPHRNPLDVSGKSDWGVLAQWLKAHPGIKLPAADRDVAAKLGISEEAVHSWVKRQRRRLSGYCAALGDLRLRSVTLTAEGGLRIPARLIKSYTITVNPKTFVTRIRVTLAGPRIYFVEMTLGAYYSIFAQSFDGKLKE